MAWADGTQQTHVWDDFRDAVSLGPSYPASHLACQCQSLRSDQQWPAFRSHGQQDALCIALPWPSFRELVFREVLLKEGVQKIVACKKKLNWVQTSSFIYTPIPSLLSLEDRTWQHVLFLKASPLNPSG